MKKFKTIRNKIYDSILDTIGNTPLVRIPRISKKYNCYGELICKLEFFNPTSSVKDRIGLAMVEKGEKLGLVNKKTTINEYYYDIDLKLSYINIFSSKNNIRDRVYSIELNSLRVDVWTMTGGGFTTREMFPTGLCKFVEISNLLPYIENLK